MKSMPLLIALAVLGLRPAPGAEPPLATGCIERPATKIAERYIERVAGSWQSFEISESRTRNERKDFFIANLGLAAGTIDTVVESREILLRKAGDRVYHLGVAELRLAAAGDLALPAQTRPQAMQRLKVLTQYVVLRRDRRALLVYSEHLQRPEVAGFFADLASDSAPWEPDCANRPASPAR